MKKSLYLLLGLLLVCGIYQACAPEELPGSIYGTVVDKATGEPIKSAGVTLTPNGSTTVTGSDGHFEFTDLTHGGYAVVITKTGYQDTTRMITVKSGETTPIDIQLEKLPPALKVVDDNRTEIDTLDFGSSIDDVARSFSIFNDGTESLEWQITTTAEWIKSVSKAEGVLSAGATQSLIVTIDRTKLGYGENKTTVHITSNNGSKQLTLLAMGQVVTKLNILSVTNVKSTSVMLHGEIVDDGIPKYTERGFVYSESSMPTIKECIKKVTIPVTNDKKYSITLDNLVTNRTYYARAYAIQKGDEVYSTNEVVFVPKSSPGKVETTNVTVYNDYSVYFEGYVIEVGEPVYTECGFVYGTNSNPTIANSKNAVAPYTGETGSFSIEITDSDLDVQSYVRAYITNGSETIYGDALTFRVNSTLPKVDQPNVTNVSSDKKQAVFNSYVRNSGYPSYTECGFVYSTSSNPTLEKGIKVIVPTNGGVCQYSTTVSDLSVNTEYYVCAFITSDAGTYYSTVTKFEVPPISPRIETLEVTNLSETTVVLQGKILTVGDPAYTERGFCYSSRSSTPTINSSKSTKCVVQGNGVGNYDLELTNLDYKTEYYYRTYAIQYPYVTYGQVMNFTTHSPMVSLSGSIVDDIGVALKDVVVKCGNNETKTDNNGKFTFDNLEIGEYYIMASRNGYETYSDYLTITHTSPTIQIKMNIVKELSYTPNSFSYTAYPGMEGSTTYSTFELNNKRDIDVQFALSNLPQKGIVFEPSSGVIPANGTISINVAFTYPSPNNGATCFTGTWYASDNQKYTRTYAWGWEEAYSCNSYNGQVAASSQHIRIILNPTNNLTNYTCHLYFRQFTIWK